MSTSLIRNSNTIKVIQQLGTFSVLKSGPILVLSLYFASQNPLSFMSFQKCAHLNAMMY